MEQGQDGGEEGREEGCVWSDWDLPQCLGSAVLTQEVGAERKGPSAGEGPPYSRVSAWFSFAFRIAFLLTSLCR